MYMAPITRARPAPSSFARRSVGVPVLLASTIVILPWLALNAVVLSATLAVVAIGRTPRIMLQAVDYAGEVALGR